VFEYQEEEDQGQANQGKPSTLLHIWILILHLACFSYYCLSKVHGLYIAVILVAIIDDLAPEVKLLSSLGMTPPWHLFIPLMSPWKTCSGAKNSRMGTLKENFKNVFQKPWGSVLLH
jgi:hypothetical protein